MDKTEKGLMTKGSIVKEIVFFSIPLLIGNLFQQMYSVIDSVMVGNYVGTDALAAVGSSTPLINMMIGLFMGFATGAGVIISQYFGADDRKNLKKATNTCVMIGFIGGIILMILGIIFSRVMIDVIGTPEDVQEAANTFLKIYFMGGIPIVMYNVVSGIMRALGDSRTPLYFLCLSSVINIMLDILFVKNLGFGIKGAGYATLISQTISAVLVFITLLRQKDIYMVSLKSLAIDSKILIRIIKVGIPAGLQQSIIAFSNVLVQGYINLFGTDAVAGCGAYIKIDGFIILPVLSFGMAQTIFIGQNYGAGKMDRVKKGAIVSSIISVSYSIIVSIILLVFSRGIVSIFSTDENVIYFGVKMLFYFAPFYIFSAGIQCFCGLLRGFSKATPPMLIMTANLCGVRLIWLFIMSHFADTIDYVCFGYPLTWITGFICFIVYMFFVKDKLFNKKYACEN